jgi:hypothetical protein
MMMVGSPLNIHVAFCGFQPICAPNSCGHGTELSSTGMNRCGSIFDGTMMGKRWRNLQFLNQNSFHDNSEISESCCRTRRETNLLGKHFNHLAYSRPTTIFDEHFQKAHFLALKCRRVAEHICCVCVFVFVYLTYCSTSLNPQS